MPVLPAPGLGRAPLNRWTAPLGATAASRLLGCLAMLLLAACTPTRITLTATPDAMESIDTVFVVAGTTEALEEKLGGDATMNDYFNFAETLRMEGTLKAGALAFVALRKFTADELSKEQADALQAGGKPLPSSRWQVMSNSNSGWLDSDFDLLGDAIVAKIEKSGFTYNPTLSVAIIVGTTEDNGDTWDHYCTRIPTQDILPGGFWFITRGKQLTFDLKAQDNPERVLGSHKLNSQAQ